MDLTIIDNDIRFGVRTCAIIISKDKKRILMQKIKDIYMLPGGRMKTQEDSYTAIKRELNEELGLITNPKLKYTVEAITEFPNGSKYHEIGYYYLVDADLDNQDNILNKDVNDGKIYFEWIDINSLDSLNIIPKEMIKYFKNISDNYEHIIIKKMVD